MALSGKGARADNRVPEIDADHFSMHRGTYSIGRPAADLSRLAP